MTLKDDSTKSTITNANKTDEIISNITKQNLNRSSFVHDENLVKEVLHRAGPATTYQRLDHVHDIATLPGETEPLITKSHYNFSSYNDSLTSLPSNSSPQRSTANISSSSIINQDPNPIRILKPTNQNVVYKQQVNIRYLQPPTPPPQAPIIIREKHLPQSQQPPIIIRQTEPLAPTPPPLVIREKAPEAPSTGTPTIIERTLPAPPPPPRQVIIERIPAPPVKPRPIIYEKWLPYKQTKRPVIIQKIKPQLAPAPKNVIIEYERPKAIAVRTIIEEGVYRVDPRTYQANVGLEQGEIRIVDRITDLPIENSKVLQSFNEIKQKLDDSNAEQYLPSQTNDSQGYYTSEIIQSLLPDLNSNDYETISTSVDESIAERIIAEAQASGATISRCASKSDVIKQTSQQTTHTIKNITVQSYQNI